MLEYVPPELVTAADIALLLKADFNGPAFNTIPPQQLVEDLWSKALLLYRMPSGVILLEINEGGDGSKRLNLVRMAGENLTLHFEAISSALQHIARDNGCNAIETLVYSEKLTRALKRGGARQEAIVMVLELDNGQEKV